ncbi:MAG: ATPase [Candidatus Saganbacteria bacterium]|uniref:ATPase n=1 Tax=Candidatus Saganbacteria bacterium TaxID=2575572 RepID=A0A833P0A1_UNCSA|nr:MAG: ATPase [Candidatus Saganbacteria bacterium]
MGSIKKKKELEAAGAILPKRAVERALKTEILPWLKRDEIIIITGARQTGKSVLLSQLIHYHLLPWTKNVHYFNLDIPGHFEFINNQDNLIALATKAGARSFVIIDEIQRLKEPGLFLKGIYDLHLPLKLIVSGSSSLEIKSKVHEALTGRKVIFHLVPFNIKELAGALFPKNSFNEIIKNKAVLNVVLDHYFTFGSYPAVAMAKGHKLKHALLKEIFHSYMEKDIKSFLKIENETAFRNLIKLLASQIGNLINKDELSNSLGIHKNTLDHYLWYLEETFILDFARPYYKNPRKELLKSPKVYFLDLGIRNFAVSSFGEFEFRPDKGAIFENFAYLGLKEKIDPLTPINFWRTKAGAEVDFVISSKLKPVPFEAKAVSLKNYKVGKSFRSFLRSYQPDKAYFLNLSLNGKRKIDGSEVAFLTPSEFIKIKQID